MSLYGSIISKINVPFDESLHLDTLTDILSYDSDYFYENMVIFIKSEKKLYFKNDGAIGDNVSHWTKLASNTSIFNPYISANSYVVGETAALGSNMFICIVAASATESPNTEPTKWLPVSTISKFTQDINNITTTVITHSIPNAICNVYSLDDNTEVDVLITRVDENNFQIDSNISISIKVIIG